MANNSYRLMVNLWSISKNNEPIVLGKLNAGTVINFNTFKSLIKNRYEFSEREFQGLLYFAFSHNPLEFEDLSAYGNIHNIRLSSPYFRKWYDGNKTTIRYNGLLGALKVTIPKDRTEADKFLEELYAKT